MCYLCEIISELIGIIVIAMSLFVVIIIIGNISTFVYDQIKAWRHNRWVEKNSQHPYELFPSKRWWG